MSNYAAHYLLSFLALAAIGPATATTVDVTSASQVTLGTGESLIFYISLGASSGSHEPLYPGEIEVLLGGMPLGGPVKSIPGTSAVYMPGIQFSGALETQNGSPSLPLIDADAARLGMPDGDMLLTPGSRSSGSYSGPIDLLSAAVTVSSQQAAAVFASGEFVIDLENTGAPITFGYPGSSIANDFSASLISPDGSESAGARVLGVECVHNTTPEPGTIGLLLIGLTIVASRASRASRLRATRTGS